MASINAEKVAQDVSDFIGKGKKVKFGQIMRKNGYSKMTSLTPQRVTETDSYKKAIKPLADRLKDEMDRILLALSQKDLSEERYEGLATAYDKLSKNYQLTTGGSTENVAVVNITKYEDPDTTTLISTKSISTTNP